MFIQPVYNILLLPDVTYFFKKDFFAGRADELKPGTQILFTLLRTDTEENGLACRQRISIRSVSPPEWSP